MNVNDKIPSVSVQVLCCSVCLLHSSWTGLRGVYLILEEAVIKVARILEGDRWEQCWVFYFCITLFQYFTIESFSTSLCWVLVCRFLPSFNVKQYSRKTYSAQSSFKSDGEDVFCGEGALEIFLWRTGVEFANMLCMLWGFRTVLYIG